MKLSLWALFCLGATTAALVSCGRTSELETDQSDLFAQSMTQHLGDSALGDADVQDELRLVTTEIQNAIFSALSTEYAQSEVRSRAVSVAGCKPKIKLVAIGVGIEFGASDTCKLQGSLDLKLFPLRTVIDLDVVGLKFVDRIQLDADVKLGGNAKDIGINLTFLNGRIGLKNIPMLANMTTNGAALLTIKSNVFQVSSRVNAFDATTGLGVALLAKIDRGAGVRDIQSCTLTGGVPSNPQGGTTGMCFRLGGN